MNNKKPLIIGIVVIIILLLGGFMFMNQRNTQDATDATNIAPTEATIPTVDSSVKVSLEAVEAGKEVLLNVSALPAGTTSIDYELSYNTEGQGLQGVIGTMTVEDGKKEVEKQMTLGTCSSGTCVYHKVEGAIQLTLRFTGDYGQKLYEKEHKI